MQLGGAAIDFVLLEREVIGDLVRLKLQLLSGRSELFARRILHGGLSKRRRADRCDFALAD